MAENQPSEAEAIEIEGLQSDIRWAKLEGTADDLRQALIAYEAALARMSLKEPADV